MGFYKSSEVVITNNILKEYSQAVDLTESCVSCFFSFGQFAHFFPCFKQLKTQTGRAFSFALFHPFKPQGYIIVDR